MSFARHRLLGIAITIPFIATAAAQEPAAEGDPTVIGQVEHTGFGLVGSRGRHYLFGGIAMADYSDSIGQRRIVTLQYEDQIQDERYLYYYELREGHRWAFAKRPAADGAYGVYFQLARTAESQTPKWQSFHRARLEQQGSGRGAGVSPAEAPVACLP